jgi:hypothetical protein
MGDDTKQAAGGVPAGGTDVKEDAKAFRIQDYIQLGTIHDSFSHTGAYVVKMTSGDTRPAKRLSAVCAAPLGARSIAQLQVGDAVLCIATPGSDSAAIIGVVPSQMTDARFVLPDSLVMCSQAGILQDDAHRQPYENDENRLPNFSCGRPVDTLQGDWGFINDLGAAIWLGRLLVQMRASDIAKVEAFVGDDLLRLFGYNLQHFTAARELFAFDDEGEYCEVERWTPFMWESLGAYEVGKEVFDEYEGDEGGAQKDRKKSRFEPKENDKQSMAFRGQTLRGYLGDGERESIVLLPEDASNISKRDDEKKYRGVLEVHKMLDGTYAVRSSKQIILEKSLIVPVPRQLLEPDDPSGDTASGDSPNYKAANYYGSGGDTQEKKIFKWDDDETAGDRATLLWEQQAYLFGKYGLQVIDAHKKDWKAPDESELKIDSSKDSEIDSALFESALNFKFAQSLPKYGEVTIDERDGYDVRYYQSRSCFHMLDDGSVVIEDGYGSQIIMSGGNITATCMGDLIQRPGRSAITWAPRDIIQRAGWCAEVSAAKKDVRIKAENSLHLRAGTEDKGNILLECVSKKFPDKPSWDGLVGEEVEANGIIVKAPDSAIDIWAKNVFAGTTGDEADGVVELNGGKGRVTIAGDEVGVEALSQFGVMVGAARSDTANPAQFGMDTTNAYMKASLFDIVGSLGVWRGSTGGGKIEAEGSVYTEENVGAVGSIFCDGVMAANGMSSNSIYNGLGGGAKPEIFPRGTAVEAEAEKQKTNLFEEFDDFTLEDTTIGAGNKEVWDAVGFSFRKSKEQYKVDDTFKIGEARWQQLYRAFSVSVQWKEDPLKAPNEEKTLPHPGYDAWETGSHYRYAEPGSAKNVDYKKGQAKKRKEQSEEAPALTEGKLKDEYRINVQLS